MIMTGTTFRVLGVRGTLGLLVLGAGIMLPVGGYMEHTKGARSPGTSGSW